MQTPAMVNNTISNPYINIELDLQLQKSVQIFQIPNPNSFSAYSKIQSRGPKSKNWPTYMYQAPYWWKSFSRETEEEEEEEEKDTST